MDEKVITAIQQALKREERSQMEIAKLVGCRQSFVSEVKNGIAKPGNYLVQFCKVLGVNPFSGTPLVKSRGGGYFGMRISEEEIPFNAGGTKQKPDPLAERAVRAIAQGDYSKAIELLARAENKRKK